MSIKRALAGLLLIALTACGHSDVTKATLRHGDFQPIPVATTISTLNSFVQAVGGYRVDVHNIVPVGVSPEDFQPTPQDVAVLSGAQLLVENGAGLEAWLQRSIQNVQNSNLRVIVCTDGLPVKGNNPHLWMDPVYAQQYVRKIRDALINLDPQHRNYYTTNARLYTLQLEKLRRDIQRKIDTIPPAQRNMIVFHNAWLYYNTRFGVKTVGVIELSPGQDPNPAYLGQLIDLAHKNNVRAVFAEPEYSPKLVQSLAQSAGIKTVQNLYDDSIGTDPRVRNYIQMLTYDTNVIVQALK